MSNLNLENNQQLGKAFQDFINTKQQAYLLRSDDRDIIYNYFMGNLKNNPNLESEENFTLNLQVFDIGKARLLIEYLKNNFSNLHLVIISFYSINEASQNALLKALEDIPENIKIILIVNIQTKLLNTVLSRLYFLDNLYLLGEDYQDINLKDLTKEFLKTKQIERMNLKGIKEILEKKDEYAEENGNKERADREILENFLKELQTLIFQDLENNIKRDSLDGIKKQSEYLEDINQSLRYIKLNSSSGKTIFEFLSLKLPIIKI